MVDSESNPDSTDQGEMEEMKEITINHARKIPEGELLKVFQDISDVTVERAIRLKQIAKALRSF